MPWPNIDVLKEHMLSTVIYVSPKLGSEHMSNPCIFPMFDSNDKICYKLCSGFSCNYTL